MPRQGWNGTNLSELKRYEAEKTDEDVGDGAETWGNVDYSGRRCRAGQRDETVKGDEEKTHTGRKHQWPAGMASRKGWGTERDDEPKGMTSLGKGCRSEE